MMIRSFSLAHGLFAFAKYFVLLTKHKICWMLTPVRRRKVLKCVAT